MHPRAVLTFAALCSLAAQPQSSLRIDGARLNAHLTALSKFGANPQGGVSRVAYSDADLQGRAYVIALMKGAGLDVHIDAAGNIVGARSGSDATLKPLLVGSHIDSVPMGGNFDGDVGSLSAIEIAQTLGVHAVTLRHPLEVIIFQNEEGGVFGSTAVTAGLTAAQLDRPSQSGVTIREGIRKIGGDPARLERSRRAPGSIAGYFELHIEQGGRLEREKKDIGVVEGIVGILDCEVTIEGFANHAGTTPMDQRHDAPSHRRPLHRQSEPSGPQCSRCASRHSRLDHGRTGRVQRGSWQSHAGPRTARPGRCKSCLPV